MTVNWKGKELIKKKDRVVADSINETMKLSVVHALNHHPEWQYRTGVAEGSIKVKDFATVKKQTGRWGSVWGGSQFSTIRVSKRTGRLNNVNYVWYLEFNHGSFLRKAADTIYPKLKKFIKTGFRVKR